jgi:hypothetical protein
MVAVTPVRLAEPCGRLAFGVRSSAFGVRRVTPPKPTLRSEPLNQ